MLTGIFARLFGCLCVLGVGMMASHAGESQADCQRTITMDGFLGRGAMTCDETWLDRLASLDVLARTRACVKQYRLNEKDVERLIANGTTSFDISVNSRGYTVTCATTNATMNVLDKIVASDPQRRYEAQEIEDINADRYKK